LVVVALAVAVVVVWVQNKTINFKYEQTHQAHDKVSWEKASFVLF
jgi:hypothetical protein